MPRPTRWQALVGLRIRNDLFCRQSLAFGLISGHQPAAFPATTTATGMVNSETRSCRVIVKPLSATSRSASIGWQSTMCGKCMCIHL